MGKRKALLGSVIQKPSDRSQESLSDRLLPRTLQLCKVLGRNLSLQDSGQDFKALPKDAQHQQYPKRIQAVYQLYLNHIQAMFILDTEYGISVTLEGHVSSHLDFFLSRKRHFKIPKTSIFSKYIVLSSVEKQIMALYGIGD